MKTRILLILVGLAINTVFAQPSDLMLPNPEDNFLSDIPIVLSASRLAQPQSESPTAITVITREMIDASTAQNVADLMRYVPGFQVGYIDANTPVVTYHGHADAYSRRIQVLIDGRSIYIPAWGGVPWTDLPLTLEDIEQIEVIRGPNAAAYGSNSFLAVISIKTRHSAVTQGQYISVKTSDDKNNNVIYRFGGQEGRLDYRLTVGSHTWDGFDSIADEHDEQFFKGRLDFQKNDKTQIMYQFGIDSTTNTDQGAETVPAHDYIVDSAYQQIKWEYNKDEINTYSIQYYYNLNDVKDSTPSVVFNSSNFDIGGITFDDFTVNIDYSIKTERHDIEFNHYYYPEKQVRFVWGASFRNDRLMAAQMLGSENAITFDIGRLFGHTEIHITDDLILNAGLMAEHHSIAGNSNSPLVSLIYKADTKNIFRLTSSEATRAPSVIEEAANNTFYPTLTIGGIGVCNLSPLLNACVDAANSAYPYPIWRSSGGLRFEKIKNIELGYFGQFLDDKLVIDAKIFEQNITNIIFQTFPDITNSDGLTFEVSDFENGITTKSTGFELSLDYQPSEDSRIGFIYANIHITDNGLSPYEELDLSAPENSYGLYVFQSFPDNTSATLEYFTYSDMQWADNSSAVSYDILNLKFSKQSVFNNHNSKASLIFRNLSGKYDDYHSYSTVGIPTISDNQIILELELKYF